MKKTLRIIAAIVLFACVLASFYISCRIFYNQGIVADETETNPAQLVGGETWLYMVWLRLGLLFAASVVSLRYVIKAIVK